MFAVELARSPKPSSTWSPDKNDDSFFFLVYSFIIIQAKTNNKRVAINYNNSKKKLNKKDTAVSYSSRVGF